MNADGEATGIVETDTRGLRISVGEINGVDFVADAREVKVPIIRRERESVSAAYNGNAAEDGEGGGIDDDDVLSDFVLDEAGRRVVVGVNDGVEATAVVTNEQTVRCMPNGKRLDRAGGRVDDGESVCTEVGDEETGAIAGDCGGLRSMADCDGALGVKSWAGAKSEKWSADARRRVPKRRRRGMIAAPLVESRPAGSKEKVMRPTAQFLIPQTNFGRSGRHCSLAPRLSYLSSQTAAPDTTNSLPLCATIGLADCLY